MQAVIMGMPAASRNGSRSSRASSLSQRLDELHEPLTGMHPPTPPAWPAAAAHAVTCSDYNFKDVPSVATGSVVIIKDSWN